MLLALVAILFVGAALASGPATRAVVAAELARAKAPSDVVAFYQARGHQPLWTIRSGLWPSWLRATLRPEAARMGQIIAQALPGEVPDRTAAQLSAALAKADSGRPRDVAEAEIALSIALGAYAGTGLSGERLQFVDPAFGLAANVRDVLQDAAEARSFEQHLIAVQRGNPIYRDLREDYQSYRSAWSTLPQVDIPAGPSLRRGDTGPRVARLHQRLGLGPGSAYGADLTAAVARFQAAHGLAATGAADIPTLSALNQGAAHFERLILANLQRARLLPPPPGNRFILVNPAAGQLWLYEDDRPTQSMRVVVGTRQMQTPMMAGQIRYLVFNPYWEVPADMARDLIAPKVMQRGLGVLRTQHLQTLADWGDNPAVIDPAQVDWPAVAAGREDLRLRQEPGGDNMMGAVKFMSPNELGIYLHDTPNKAAFQASGRLLSAGCVRVERSDDLVAWLLGQGMGDTASLGVDNRIDLEAPTPVYITYLTAAPGDQGVVFHPDVYGRDAAALAGFRSGMRASGGSPTHGG